MSDVIDLSQLPPPSVIAMPAFEDLLAQRLAELQALDPVFTALLDSDPAVKLLQISCYREMVNVARTNAGVLATLLAYARGADLDQLGANFDVYRLVITPADDTPVPPTDAVMEGDDAFRLRIRLSWYARNTAGSIQAYEYFALSADGAVRDAKAYGPQEEDAISPGHVEVYVLSNDGGGVPPQALLDTVDAALNADFIRPLTDYVVVKAATLIEYAVTATLMFGSGPDAQTVMTAAKKAMQHYADSVHRIGVPLSIAGVYKALKQPGVEDVTLTAPRETLYAGTGEATYCTAITLTTSTASTQGAPPEGL
ncbi:baseplate assembly protein [Serratia quinivorans]|uniref:Baseplate J-like protein n=1 Tax=Serratia quinivorans TaxID=137545 RepID=A0A379YFH0_9GAMM|nr:baseplate J/gp47 family protein [Serratia quinivorans]CAI1716826.1 Baseplate J-like protein [Serratia quinivorans]SUI43895.1 Baseplate J-like protein [Serratia quinivorans]